MVDRQAQYGQDPNRIVDVSTFLGIGQSLRELERLIDSFGRTLTDNERRLQQTLPGMIKTFDRIEKEYASGNGKLSKSQAADLKVMVANEQNILKWLDQLTRFNPKTGLALNERNDQSFIRYASIFEEVMQKLTASMQRAYKKWDVYNKHIDKVRKAYGFVPTASSTTTNVNVPTATATISNAKTTVSARTGPASALSRPFNFMVGPTQVKDDIENFGIAITDFFQNLHKTFANVIIVNKATASLKKMSDSYKGGVALQGSKGAIDALYSKFESKYNQIQTMQNLQKSVANAGANLRAQYPGYNYSANTPSSIAQPPKSKLISQSLGKGGAKVGMGITKAASLALKAIPLVGAIATGVSIIFKQMKKSSPVLQAVSDIMSLAWNLMWMPFGNALGQYLIPLAEDMINFAIMFNELFTDFSMDKLMEVYYSGLQMIWGMLFDVGNVITSFIVDGIFSLFSDFFRSIGLDGIADYFDTIKNGIHTIRDFVRNLPTHIYEGLKNILPLLKEAFSNIVKSMPGGDMLEAATNGDLVSAGKSAWNNTIGNWTGFKLASGGVVTGPTIAMVGEAGPEAVIPLDKAGGIGATYVININGDVYGVSDLESRIERVIQRTANKSYYR